MRLCPQLRHCPSRSLRKSVRSLLIFPELILIDSPPAWRSYGPPTAASPTSSVNKTTMWMMLCQGWDSGSRVRIGMGWREDGEERRGCAPGFGLGLRVLFHPLGPTFPNGSLSRCRCMLVLSRGPIQRRGTEWGDNLSNTFHDSSRDVEYHWRYC
jgi:hypothetical protein